MIRRPFDFRVTVAAYVAAAIGIALLIHFVVLGSPMFSWMFPVSGDVRAGAAVNPATRR